MRRMAKPCEPSTPSTLTTKNNNEELRQGVTSIVKRQLAKTALRVGLVALLVFAAGCRTAAPRPQTQAEPATTETAPLSAADDPSSGDVFSPRAAPDEQATTSRSEIFPGSGELVNRRALNRNRQEGPAEDGELVFNFEGVSLQEVVKAILGDVLQENYVIAPGVGGEVTFATAKPVRPDQALPILEMLLSWNNASLVYLDGRYNVLPKADAIKGHLTPTTAALAGQRGYQVRAYPLDYLAPTEMEKLLQPYVRDGAIISADNSRGMITIAGTRDEHRNYSQTIDVFDVDWLAGMSVGIFPLQRVEVATVVTELEAVFGEGAGTPLAGMFRFLPIERLNAVLVITPQADYLNKAADWVGRLDRGGSEAGTRLYVYEVRNVKAVDLADTLNQVFGGSTPNRSTRDAGQLAPGLQAGEIRSINDPRSRRDNAANQNEQSNTNRQPAATSRAGGGVAIVDGEEISITAVEESNSLLIRTSPQQYDSVLAAIKRLDIEPLQVHIEVQVLEVTLNDNLTYGVEWYLENAVRNEEFSSALGSQTAPEALSGGRGLFGTGNELSTWRSLRLGGGGIGYAIRGADAGALVDLLKSETELRTISAPSLMVLNNREATINVGTQIPVNSTFINDGFGGDTTRTRVQFRDTGATLSVIPRVNPGGMVFMEIDQEVSNPIGDINSGNNLPVSTRRLSTEIAVQSGETVVLGGLIRADQNIGDSGVPGLKDIPLIGGLFGSKSNVNDRTELLLLITPTVAENSAQAREISREYQDKMQGLEPFDLEDVRINYNPRY